MYNTLCRGSYLLLVILVSWGYIRFFLNKGIAVACSFYTKTNLLCPGCGAQRAVSSLFAGNIRLALEYNALIFIYLGVLLYLYVALMEVYLVKNDSFLVKYAMPTWAGYFFILLVLSFCVFRNI